MKHLLAIIMLCFALNANSQIVDYGNCAKQVKTEIKTAKKDLKEINKQIKQMPNDVELHKKAVVVKTNIENCKAKLEKIKYAQKLYKELAKRNAKFDKEKVYLLHLKENSKIADDEVLSVIK